MTEGLAACLEAAPDAARALVQKVFGVSPPGEVSVHTQQTTGYGRPDLEIWFSQGTSVVHPVFEVKVDSRAYAEQGVRYMEWLRGGAADWHFAWLLRVGRNVEPTRPAPARLCTWQDVATALHDWLRSQDDALHGPALVKQYVRHLEDEQLASTQGLTKDYALAVNNLESAQTAVDVLLTQARERILQDWRVPLKEGQQWFDRHAPWWFWQHLEKRGPSDNPDWQGPAFLQWDCARDDGRPLERRRGEFAVGAGVVFWANKQPLPGRDDAWLERRRGGGFEYLYADPWPRVFRWLPLSEIPDTPGFAEQVDLVVKHVQTTLELLVADPPAASAQEPPPPEQPVE